MWSLTLMEWQTPQSTFRYNLLVVNAFSLWTVNPKSSSLS